MTATHQAAPHDFVETVTRLEQRARMSRRRARWVMVLLGVVLVVAAGLVALETVHFRTMKFGYIVTNKEEREWRPGASMHLDRTGPESPMAGHVMYLLERLNGPDNPYYVSSFALRDIFRRGSDTKPPDWISPTPAERDQIKAELKVALDDLERAAHIADIGKRPPSIAEEIRPIVSTFFYSIGVVGGCRQRSTRRCSTW